MQILPVYSVLAVDAAHLDPGVPITAIGVVGEDEMGGYLLTGLARYPSINLSQVRRQGDTSFTDVITLANGGRTFFQYQGSNALLQPGHFQLDALQADILHVGYLLLLNGLDTPSPPFPTALCRVLADARKRGLQTSVDTISDPTGRYGQIVHPALHFTGYCIVNELEAGYITDIPLRRGRQLIPGAVEPCLKRMAELGVGRWAVIHGPELSCGLDVAGGRYITQPSPSLPEGFIRSSVGAGDSFATTVLLGAWYGWNLARSLAAASAAAAYSLKGTGASDALKPLDALLREMGPWEAAPT